MSEAGTAERGAGRARAAGLVVRIGVLLALLAPALALVALIGRMADAMPLETALRILLDWTPIVAVLGALAGLFALVASFRVRPRWWIAVGAAALVLPVLVLLATAGMRAQRTINPPVHEVATDWNEPIGLSRRLLTLRGPEATPVVEDPRIAEPWAPGGGAIREAWGAQRVADLNRLACPTARPVPRMVAPDVVQRVLERNGAIVAGSAPWRVEGTVRSTWLHLYSDVAVRMRPERTDVRAVGREPGGDLGETCRLVTRIVRDLEDASR